MSDPILGPVMDYVHAATSAQEQLPTRLATITALNTDGTVNVRFDGETAASTKKYPRAIDCSAYTSDRVVMLRVGTTWVCSAVLANASTNEGGLRLIRRDEFATLSPISFPWSNTGAWQSAYQGGSTAIPTGARMMYMQWDIRAVSGANNACFWRCFSFWNGSTNTMLVSGFRAHNNGVAALAMGSAMSGWAYVPTNATSYLPAADVNVDSGGTVLYGSTGNCIVTFFA